ncbi:diguanylate cyclase [Hoeflea marina]|uniref:diguanylate cyclase n=1 Tax=Hoeflea marina TaxID=274592 RepID=A0A317PMS0_9HYPH|nr:GGDEF domain-containing protein [Hoeflea marina]PWW01823.1 diguanylate cyclase [Hoeflea marina]
MYQLGIDGLPRNYELVYEAYGGNNPELAREFVAIGKVKSQRALDELGKKYLPHHHEESLLARTNERMRQQMSSFQNLLKQEKSSLTSYGKIIDETSRSFKANGEIDREALSRSITELSRATRSQASANAILAAGVEEQSAELEQVKSELENTEMAKFLDPLTGLANRRAFNKAVARIYTNAALPMMCGLAYADIDNFRQLGGPADSKMGDHFIRQVGNLIQAGHASADFMARLDGNRFAFLFNTSDDQEVIRLVDQLRAAVGAKQLISPKNGASVGLATLSIGVVMTTVATNAGELMEFAEQALTASMKGGGNKVSLYSTALPTGTAGDWKIYNP